jgi:flavin-dependent dehydrogenase
MDKIYADFRQEIKVKKITRQGNTWKIMAQNNTEEIYINADFIIGADGDHSTVLRSLGERKIDRQNYAGALRQYWKGISNMNPGNHLEIYLPKSLPLAYLWIFPLPNGEANVGLGLSSEIISKKNVDLKKLLHQLITEDPALKHRFTNATPLEKPVGWGLPLASQKRKASGDGYLLVGDAAALVSPTTGEGVGPGMMSGFIAATFIERAYKANSFDAASFKNYDREIYKRLQAEIKNYNTLRKISPRLYNIVINICSMTGIGKYYFKTNSSKWVQTASKAIDVNM